MSGDPKVLDQNTVSGIQAQPTPPAGAANKEIGPVSVVSEIRPSGPEVRHDIKGLENAGVEENNDRPVLTEEHRQAGVDHAGPSVPVPSGPTGQVTLPLTREEAVARVKNSRPTDSIWGLAKLVLKGFKVGA